MRSRELRLGPPLPEPVLSAFEHEHGIGLPEDYRWFLAEIGNGGDGPPSYGLAPLTDALDETGAKANAHIGRPNPLTEAWVWEDEPVADPGAVDAAYEPRAGFLGWYAAWLAEL